ncbi:hypothetical protein AX774_g2835 [Zancudomyces culisetae]|uniref:Uncharacterized protein n=1 Tax=Zancudomyces culisetae TaxID=1213189 RepID=A0A1R1PRY3_ZANCU|nr:hypothetical protein AX774_g2835 [Zancudomyces culisetae]|eukprot:OMH83652.1 hypothetical protein AX774_g2835 [Zancudomyces culisetae]
MSKLLTSNTTMLISVVQFVIVFLAIFSVRVESTEDVKPAGLPKSSETTRFVDIIDKGTLSLPSKNRLSSSDDGIFDVFSSHLTPKRYSSVFSFDNISLVNVCFSKDDSSNSMNCNCYGIPIDKETILVPEPCAPKYHHNDENYKRFSSFEIRIDRASIYDSNILGVSMEYTKKFIYSHEYEYIPIKEVIYNSCYGEKQEKCTVRGVVLKFEKDLRTYGINHVGFNTKPVDYLYDRIYRVASYYESNSSDEIQSSVSSENSASMNLLTSPATLYTKLSTRSEKIMDSDLTSIATTGSGYSTTTANPNNLEKSLPQTPQRMHRKYILIEIGYLASKTLCSLGGISEEYMDNNSDALHFGYNIIEDKDVKLELHPFLVTIDHDEKSRNGFSPFAHYKFSGFIDFDFIGNSMNSDALYVNTTNILSFRRNSVRSHDPTDLKFTDFGENISSYNVDRANKSYNSSVTEISTQSD